MSQTSRPIKAISRRAWIQRVGLGILGGAILAACSTENDHYVVKISPQNGYDPGSLTIPVGTTVTWQNISIAPFTVTCDPTKAQAATHVQLPPKAQPWDSGTLYPGQTWSYTFDTPGNYIYFSRTQETESSLGSITVTT